MHTLKAEKGYLLLIGFLTHTDLTKLCEVAPENKDVLSIFLHSFSKYFTEKFLPKWQKKFLNHCIISWLFIPINYICTYCHINSSCTLMIQILSYQLVFYSDDTFTNLTTLVLHLSLCMPCTLRTKVIMANHSFLFFAAYIFILSYCQWQFFLQRFFFTFECLFISFILSLIKR